MKVHRVLNKQAGFDPLDPMRAANAKQYDLVYRKDKTNCPKQVKRCESCKFQFNVSHVVLVRTMVNRSWTDKNGNKRNTSGNVYLHYLITCLKDHDDDFSFNKVTVLKEAINRLPDDSKQKLKKQGLCFQH